MEDKQALFARDIFDNNDAAVLGTDKPFVFGCPIDLGEGQHRFGNSEILASK